MARHLSYANVVATLALFVALGGGAYAATKLPKNSVTTKQVKDRSLLAKDFKKGQIKAGQTGPQGLRGLGGPAGPPGLTGAPGAKGDTGAAGSAKAFAFIEEGVDGTTVTQAQGIKQGDVSFVNETYCVSGLSFTPRNAQVTPGPSGPLVASVQVPAGAGDCAGKQVAVQLRALAVDFAGTVFHADPTSGPFYIEIN